MIVGIEGGNQVTLLKLNEVGTSFKQITKSSQSIRRIFNLDCGGVVMSGDDLKSQSSMLIRFDRYMQQRETQILGSLCLSAASFNFKEADYFAVGL